MMLNYEIRYTNRKRTIAIAINPDKKIIVSSPKYVSNKEIDKFVAEKQDWILKKLKYFEENEFKYRKTNFLDGEIHTFLGNEYTLKVVEAIKDKVYLSDNYLIVENSRINNQFSTRNIVKLWYFEQAVKYIEEKSKDIFKSFQAKVNIYPSINFRKTKSRWGSCSNKGKVTFNPDLIKFHPKCIEYVIIHEFCHLIEHNHGKNFYKLLESKMPDYKKWRKLLT